MFHELIFLFIHECNCATVSDAIDTAESQPIQSWLRTEPFSRIHNRFEIGKSGSTMYFRILIAKEEKWRDYSENVWVGIKIEWGKSIIMSQLSQDLIHLKLNNKRQLLSSALSSEMPE